MEENLNADILSLVDGFFGTIGFALSMAATAEAALACASAVLYFVHKIVKFLYEGNIQGIGFEVLVLAVIVPTATIIANMTQYLTVKAGISARDIFDVHNHRHLYDPVHVAIAKATMGMVSLTQAMADPSDQTAQESASFWLSVGSQLTNFTLPAVVTAYLLTSYDGKYRLLNQGYYDAAIKAVTASEAFLFGDPEAKRRAEAERRRLEASKNSILAWAANALPNMAFAAAQTPYAFMRQRLR